MTTATEIISTVRELADERPEFRYQAPYGDECLYFHEGAPSCIIGHALARHGITDCVEEESAGFVLESLGIEAKLYQRRWLEAVQNAQDHGTTWSHAVEHATRVVGDL